MPVVWEDSSGESYLFDSNDIGTFDLRCVFLPFSSDDADISEEVQQELLALSIRTNEEAKEQLRTLGQRWKHADREGLVNDVREIMRITINHSGDRLIASYHLICHIAYSLACNAAGARPESCLQPPPLLRQAAVQLLEERHPAYNAFIALTSLDYQNLATLTTGLQPLKDISALASISIMEAQRLQEARAFWSSAQIYQSQRQQEAQAFWGSSHGTRMQEQASSGEEARLPATFASREEEIAATAAFFKRSQEEVRKGMEVQNPNKSAMAEASTTANEGPSSVRLPRPIPSQNEENSQNQATSQASEVQSVNNNVSGSTSANREQADGEGGQHGQDRVESENQAAGEGWEEDQDQVGAQSVQRDDNDITASLPRAARETSPGSDTPLVERTGHNTRAQPARSNAKSSEEVHIGGSTKAATVAGASKERASTSSQPDTAPKSAKPQQHIPARKRIIVRHLCACSNCTMHGLVCNVAGSGGWKLKCTPCRNGKKTKPPCDHKEWLNQRRVAEWSELVHKDGYTELEADAIVYGKTAVFGNQHDKVSAEEYMTLPANFREAHCSEGFWDSAWTERGTATPRPYTTPRSSMTPFPAGSRAQSMTPTRQRAHSTTNATAFQQDRQEPNTPTRGGFKRPATETLGSESKRPNVHGSSTGSHHDSNVFMSPKMEVSLDRPHSFFEGTKPHLSPENFTAEAIQAYKAFIVKFSRHTLSHVAGGHEAREMVLTATKEEFLDSMHRLCNFRGGSFTESFGVGAEKRRT